MKTINELTEALLAVAAEAAAGNANPEQVQTLCLSVETIIKLARLELEVRAAVSKDRSVNIGWISESVNKPIELKDSAPRVGVSPQGKRLLELESEIKMKEKQLLEPEISSQRVNSLNQELASLKKKYNALKQGL